MEDIKTKFATIKFHITIIVLLASIVASFALTTYKTTVNSGRISILEHENKSIKEIQYNLKILCEKQGVKYIELKDKWI